MDKEKGLSGVVHFRESRLTVDEWRFGVERDVVCVYFDKSKFGRQMATEDGPSKSLIGQEMTVRLDSESGVFYGEATVIGMAMPRLTRGSPHDEHFPRDLVLYYRFAGEFGPYSLSQGRAMARNGNILFFDLLGVSELESMIASGDVRFLHRAAGE